MMRTRKRVIDQDGVELHERPSGLRAAWAMMRSRAQDDEPALLRRTPNTGPDDLAGVSRMPFTITRARDLVRLGFEALEREMDRRAAALAVRGQTLAGQNHMHMKMLDERLERLAARQRAWIAREDGHAMAAAYEHGGTELVAKMTPDLLARMDEMAKAAAA